MSGKSPKWINLSHSSTTSTAIAILSTFVILSAAVSRQGALLLDGVSGAPLGSSRSGERLLDCAESRYFWIDWTAPRISLGRGSDVGADQILSVVVDDDKWHEVNAVAVATSDKAAGVWTFSQHVGGSSIKPSTQRGR